MNEIYWLTRVGVISDIGRITLILSLFVLMISPILVNMADLEEWD